MTAIDRIVIQGEGSPGPYDDPDKLEEDHYDVFLDLKTGDTSWEVYPVVENPVTSDYWKLDKRIYQVYSSMIREINVFTDEKNIAGFAYF